jgi:hypothetical protein
MPPRCTVCDHPERGKIDRTLARLQAPIRDVARRYSLDKSAVHRHSVNHLPRALAKATEAAAVANGDRLLGEVDSLLERTRALLDDAEEEGDRGHFLKGVREARGCIELLAKLTGQLNEAPQVNILTHPDWVTLRATMLGALQDHPDALAAVVEAVRRLDQSQRLAVTA